jgi:predicted DNA-binding protein (MmcQ/YjbR family)
MDEARLTNKEWEYFLLQSYELVKLKLPRKVRESLENE